MYNFESFSVKVNQNVLIRPQKLNFPEKGLFLIIGANGIGKTTFLKQLATHLLRIHKNLKISFVSSIQIYERELSLSGKEFYSLYSQKPWTNDILSHFGHLLSKRIDHMSSGEFQALILISNFMENSDVLLVDEPISHLSPEWAHFFVLWMNELKNTKLIITVSHQMTYLQSTADQIFEIKDLHLVLKQQHVESQIHDIH